MIFYNSCGRYFIHLSTPYYIYLILREGFVLGILDSDVFLSQKKSFNENKLLTENHYLNNFRAFCYLLELKSICQDIDTEIKCKLDLSIVLVSRLTLQSYLANKLFLTKYFSLIFS